MSTSAPPRVFMDDTYTRPDPSGTIHRNRLRGVTKAFEDLDLATSGRIADFSPSNGYMIEDLQATAFRGKRWMWDCFEMNASVVDLWTAKQLPETTFTTFNITEPPPVERLYDVVLSIGMFEHIPAFRPGLETILDACKPGGYIVLGVPNEQGFAGMMKFLGRDVLRADHYDSFFDEHSKLQYARALLLGQRVDTFRRPQDWYKTHLGWDIRQFATYMRSRYAAPTCELLSHTRTLGGCNWLWVFRRGAVVQ